MTLTRRNVITAAASAPMLTRAARVFAAASGEGASRLYLLGTGGGPVLGGDRRMAAHAISCKGKTYLVDVGYGAAGGLAQAGIAFSEIEAICITHFHADHILDYGPLLFFLPVQGRTEAVDAYGPPPLGRHTELLIEANKTSLDYFRQGVALPPMPPVRTHEVTTFGRLRDDGVARISCTTVIHPPLVPSLAYRFDLPDRSIVFSGDTSYSENLIELARGADILVHEAAIVPLVLKMMMPGGSDGEANETRPREYDIEKFEQHVRRGHTSAEDAGKVAAAAGVKTLVLSHVSPGSHAMAPDGLWLREASKHFGGQIVVAYDGMEL